MAKLGARSPRMEAAVGFALGAVAGCVLGLTEDPVDMILSIMMGAGQLKPVLEEVQTVGALGLGTLMGATALTTAMTTAVAGVILAAILALVFVVVYSSSQSSYMGLWVCAAFAGAVGTTLSGATLGIIIEWIVKSYSMMGLLWALSIFTALKAPLYFLFKLLQKQAEACCTLGSEARSREREQIEILQSQQRQRMAVQVEKTILMLEKGGSSEETEPRATWLLEQKQREEIERKKMASEEAEMEHRTIKDWINTTVVKLVDLLAFSGIPMAAITIVTSGLGVFGYGNHQSVFLVLLVLVAVIAYFLLKSPDCKFWMLVGCMGMLATFVIALLTLHAGQVVITTSIKMRAAGQNHSRENISIRMAHQSSLEALKAAFFAAKLCELGLGAAVGGVLVRHAAGEVRVITGSAVLALGLLVGIEVFSPILGKGGAAGALLGVVGVAGVSVGATAALVGMWSSWAGTLGTMAGLGMGAVGMGKWHFINIGLQMPVAYVFAMTNPF